MDPSDLPAYLESLKKATEISAPDVANALARTAQRAVQSKLREHSHPAGLFYRAATGAAPSYVTGNLSKSIVRTPAAGAIRSSAWVGATAVYSAIQEFGGWTWGNHGMMHWHNSAGRWFMRRVYVPEHPFMRPAVEGAIRDGSLSRSAISAFEKHVGFFFRG
jgi:phage gpG-like protein